MLLISYDLHRPGQNYQSLIAAIKTHDWAHVGDSTWLIRTELGAQQVANNLHQYMDGNDTLLVTPVARQQLVGWLKEEIWNWVNRAA